MDAFITSTELSAFTGATVEDDFAVDAACEVVRTLTEQSINLVADDEIVVDGSGTDALLLPQSPVVEVASVLDDDADEVTDWILNPNGLLILTESCDVWTRGRQNFTITYTHGYETVPDDLRMVALSIAGRLLRKTDAESETLGAYSVRYTSSPTDATAGERAILRKYRLSQ